MASFHLINTIFSLIILNTIHIRAKNINHRLLQQDYNNTTQPIYQSTIQPLATTSITQTNFIPFNDSNNGIFGSLNPVVLILIAILTLCVCCFFGLLVFYIPYSRKQTQELKQFIDQTVDTMKKQQSVTTNIPVASPQTVQLPSVSVSSLTKVRSVSATHTKPFHYRRETLNNRKSDKSDGIQIVQHVAISDLDTAAVTDAKYNSKPPSARSTRSMNTTTSGTVASTKSNSKSNSNQSSAATMTPWQYFANPSTQPINTASINISPINSNYSKLVINNMNTTINPSNPSKSVYNTHNPPMHIPTQNRHKSQTTLSILALMSADNDNNDSSGSSSTYSATSVSSSMDIKDDIKDDTNVNYKDLEKQMIQNKLKNNKKNALNMFPDLSIIQSDKSKTYNDDVSSKGTDIQLTVRMDVPLGKSDLTLDNQPSVSPEDEENDDNFDIF